MKFLNYFLCSLAMVAVAASAKSFAHDLKSSAKIDTDVYVVGTAISASGKSVAAYWENGVIKKLSDSTLDCFGKGIAINGHDDVYIIADYIDDNGKSVATYWENGIKTKLTNNSIESSANGIAVMGNDVYITGTLIDTAGHHAVYWKNGMVINLSPPKVQSEAHAIATKGTDLYVSGRIIDPEYESSAYWKNGMVTQLKDTLLSYGSAVALDGANIYIGGYTTNSTFKRTATYWKNNGKTIALTNGSSNAEVLGIAAKDNHVYAVGYINVSSV